MCIYFDTHLAQVFPESSHYADYYLCIRVVKLLTLCLLLLLHIFMQTITITGNILGAYYYYYYSKHKESPLLLQ